MINPDSPLFGSFDVAAVANQGTAKSVQERVGNLLHANEALIKHMSWKFHPSNTLQEDIRQATGLTTVDPDENHRGFAEAKGLYNISEPFHPFQPDSAAGATLVTRLITLNSYRRIEVSLAGLIMSREGIPHDFIQGGPGLQFLYLKDDSENPSKTLVKQDGEWTVLSPEEDLEQIAVVGDEFVAGISALNERRRMPDRLETMEELEPRAATALRQNGIYTIPGLLAIDGQDFTNIPGVGGGINFAIKTAIQQHTASEQ